MTAPEPLPCTAFFAVPRSSPVSRSDPPPPADPGLLPAGETPAHRRSSLPPLRGLSESLGPSALNWGLKSAAPEPLAPPNARTPAAPPALRLPPLKVSAPAATATPAPASTFGMRLNLPSDPPASVTGHPPSPPAGSALPAPLPAPVPAPAAAPPRLPASVRPATPAPPGRPLPPPLPPEADRRRADAADREAPLPEVDLRSLTGPLPTAAQAQRQAVAPTPPRRPPPLARIASVPPPPAPLLPVQRTVAPSPGPPAKPLMPEAMRFDAEPNAPVVVRHTSLPPAPMPAPTPTMESQAPPGEATLRFNDTRLFIDFLMGPFTRRTLDLRLAESHDRGASMWIVLQVGGLRDPIRLRGRVHEHLHDGRTRIVLAGDPGVQAWLGGFVTAWQLGIDTASAHPDAEPERARGEDTRRSGATNRTDPETRPIDPQKLADRLDQLTYYELLGVAAEAPADDIQQAFHVLSRAYHPDLFHGRGRGEVSLVNSLFRRINEAYSVLRVPARRRAYDEGLAGPRAQWRLRWREDEEAARRRNIAGLDPRERGEHYWSRAITLLDRNSATRTDVAATTVRLLRTAAAFEPDQKEYAQLLEDIVAGRPLHRKRSPGTRPSR